MNILVINCGSSSLKYQLLDMTDERVLANGLVERIGIDGSCLKHQAHDDDKVTIEVAMKDHKEALHQVLDALTHQAHGAIKSLDAINAVGHRVVHAGERYAESVLIDDDVIAALEACIPLAPLHNPPNLTGIKAMRELLPSLPMVAVFDTAFHQTMPAEAYIYALPYEYYEKHSVRRYGFHGTSHRYVVQRAAEMMNRDLKDLKLISCHLGNGASVAAVDGGKVIDTSMGFTPLEGLVMGTRCGDMDPAIATFLMQNEGLSVKELDTVMNKKSGVLGISGVSSDFRDIEGAAKDGNARAQLALDVFNRRVKKYIAAYAAVLGGVDGVIFTAGLGENSATNRKEICQGLEFMGIEVDDAKNAIRGKDAFICAEQATVSVMVIPTNEELMIARDTKALAAK